MKSTPAKTSSKIDLIYHVGRRLSHYKMSLNTMWSVLFWVVMAQTNPTSCQGRLYSFGQDMKWYLPGLVLWNMLGLLGEKYIPKRGSRPSKIMFVFPIIYYTALWILAISAYKALGERFLCSESSLNYLTQFWLFVSFLPYIVFLIPVAVFCYTMVSILLSGRKKSS